MSIFFPVSAEVFSECVGWDLSRNIDTQLTLNALLKALQIRKMADLKDIGIQISMSRKGNPYDNAFAESFMKTLKYEEIYLNEYKRFNDALQNIEHFIEEVYNLKRLHSSIGYKSPVDFEKAICLNISP